MISLYILFYFELWLQALSGLHDQIPPFPRDVAMKIIEEELGSPVEAFFRYISEEPVAAASFGQVDLFFTIKLWLKSRICCYLSMHLYIYLLHAFTDLEVVPGVLYASHFRSTGGLLLMVLMLLWKFNVPICIMW